MQLELGFGEILTLLIGVTGLGWALLKIVFAQFDEKQEVRHQAVYVRFEGLERKVNSIDSLVLEVKKLEIEQLRRDNLYSDKFATKNEMVIAQDKHDKVLDRIFTLLETMNSKLDSKANRADCDALHSTIRLHGSQHTPRDQAND